VKQELFFNGADADCASWASGSVNNYFVYSWCTG